MGVPRVRRARPSSGSPYLMVCVCTALTTVRAERDEPTDFQRHRGQENTTRLWSRVSENQLLLPGPVSAHATEASCVYLGTACRECAGAVPPSDKVYGRVMWSHKGISDLNVPGKGRQVGNGRLLRTRIPNLRERHTQAVRLGEGSRAFFCVPSSLVIWGEVKSRLIAGVGRALRPPQPDVHAYQLDVGSGARRGRSYDYKYAFEEQQLWAQAERPPAPP